MASSTFGQKRSDSSAAGAGRLRADLHVHSRYSRPCHLGRLGAASAPGAPDEIDRAARARGMDLVTITDRDTIDGCLDYLDRHPKTRHFFISVEITARDPRHGARLHVLVYGIDEAQHRELARRRNDVRELLSYAHAEGIPASLGPWFGDWRGEAPAEGFIRETLALFRLFEVANGSFSADHNRMALRLAHEARGENEFGVTAGSGAHGPARAGRTGTVAEGGSREEFLRALREGRAGVAGEPGSRWASVADLYRVLRHDEKKLAGSAPLLIRHGLERVRLGARLRSGHRRLDQIEVHRFQEKTRSYRASVTPGSDPDGAADSVVTPSQHASSITTIE